MSSIAKLRASKRTSKMLGRLAALVVFILAASACGGSSSSETKTTEETTTTSAAVETTTTAEEPTSTTAEAPPALPAGQRYGPFDLNDDGVPDAMCGNQDFGNGLVLQKFCNAEGYEAEVREGVTLTPSSLFRFPSNSEIGMDGISGDLIQGADPADKVLYVIVFATDAMFATGGSDIVAPETFDNVVRLVNTKFPGARLQVRGHTDSTGDPGSNQTLSEARAASVKNYLTGHGVQAAEVTTVGFGETQPLALDDTDAGKQFNRRVELVIRPAA